MSGPWRPSPADLARPEVRALPRYSPEGGLCAVDVSDNTNLWGAPPAALRALQETPGGALARYPTLYSEPLRTRIVRYLELPSETGVVLGCGSDDVIDSAMRAFGQPGDRVAFAAPTFSMIPTFARLNALEPVAVPYAEGFTLDVERLVERGAKVTYLCTPNNPTATLLSRAAVEYVAEHARGIVLLDEAYAEFAPETFADIAVRFDRVLLLRTFSKAFGLAGLRVGYAVGSPALCGLVERARGPYKVNALAERAVSAALEEGEEGVQWVRAHAALAVETRARLAEALTARGWAPLPSGANFLCVPVRDAAAVAAALRTRGVLVRALGGLDRSLECFARSDGGALRIGVGPWPMMHRLLEALDGLFAEQRP